jgi:peptide/nickel transport system substrate-binding protein
LIIFNLSHKNAVRREIFNNRDFRIGLSYALNRDEIIQVAHQRQGEPWQAAPRPESPFYDEAFAKQYTEFDLAKANDHLDRAGYRKDGQGRRIGPDGKPIAFNMAFAAGSVARPSDTLELVRKHWQAVGIDARLQPQERSLLASQNESNDSDVYAWEGDGGLNPTLVPDWYFPDPAYLTFARGWSNWYDDPESEDAMEPPAPIKEQMKLYDQIRATTNRDEQVAHTKALLEIAKENFWVMGTVLTPVSYGIASEKFRNVPVPVDPAQPFYQIDVCQSYFSS